MGLKRNFFFSIFLFIPISLFGSDYSGYLYYSTTLGYQPHQGSFEGYQHDATIGPGVAYELTEKFSLEFTPYVTLVHGDYDSTGVLPGFAWAFSDHFYVDNYFLFQIDPGFDFGLIPGIGFTFPISKKVSPFIETEFETLLAKGEPDLSIILTVGASYAF